MSVAKRLAALLGVLVLGVVPAAVAADGTVYRFQDDDITEASALLDEGAVNLTINDSGNGPIVYVVDGTTGLTVGTTDYEADVRDVEALAPAGDGEVWVGDIGDNGSVRKDISIYRVPFAKRSIKTQGQAVQLAYPDGAHDAESLLAGPNGRIYVITKALGGGSVYATDGAPSTKGTNRLAKVADVDVYATDAALFPDARHVIVRSYGTATVYSFPGWKELGWFRLPAQKQGEGISVGPGNRIRLSSEGEHQPVLQIPLSAGLSVAMGYSEAPTSTPSPNTSTTPSPTATAAPPVTIDDDEVGDDDPSWLVWAVPVILALGAAGIGLGLGLRRRR